jgi:Histidinol phosphatase and related hydrolases of the PHP family
MLHWVDYHVHTAFSDGEPTYVQVLDKAKEIGLESLAITDHFDKYDENPKTASLTEDDLFIHFDTVREYADRIGLKVLCGIETCTDFFGNLRLSQRVIDNSDIVITSPHYVEYDGILEPGNYFDQRYWESYKQKVINMAGGQGDILGHCEAYLPFSGLLVPGTTTFEQRKQICRNIADKFFDYDYISDLIKALERSGKALELHGITETPRESVIEALVKSGIKMSTGSDAHDIGRLGNTKWGIEMLEKYEGQMLQYLK